jgi:hypothetical protein
MKDKTEEKEEKEETGGGGGEGKGIMPNVLWQLARQEAKLP